MSSVLDQVSRELNPGTVSNIGRQLGVDQQTAQQAVALALPMLIGGLARNVEQPGGAASLSSALNDHGSTLENMASIFGNPSSGPGAGILGHIFGQRQPAVESGIGGATGLNPQKISQLLMILAPIVMGVLAKQKQQKSTAQPGTNPGAQGDDIASILRDEKQEIERKVPGMGGVLGGIFDQNKDGQVVDDLARIAQSGSLGGLLGGLLGGKR